VSTIKVDTYLTRGGASEIAIDKLKGASSASSISVVAEGGTNTTNLQQGLAKCWVTHPHDDVVDDSFNLSSLTDSATGRYVCNFTNNMASTKYIVPAANSRKYTKILFVPLEGAAENVNVEPSGTV